MNLKKLGWSSFWKDLEYETKQLARITTVHRSHCVALCEDGEVWLYFSGKFQVMSELESDYPAVGDWVQMSPIYRDQNDRQAALIQSVLPRYSKLSRATPSGEQVLASNVEQVFIVTSMNQDLNQNRLQRYILLAKEGGVEPIVVFSKMDLVDNSDFIISEWRNKLNGVEVLAVSAIKHEGVEVLRSLFKEGTTSVFVGSSGVGKSTLVNGLVGSEVQATGDIRSDDAKGRHTTSSRDLFSIPNGGMIIDTAGLREVQVFGEEQSLRSTFNEIDVLSEDCKYSDCQHSGEPGCAVTLAVERRDLDESILKNYEKLAKEMRHINRKMDKKKSLNDKRRWKQLSKNIRMKKKIDGR